MLFMSVLPSLVALLCSPSRAPRADAGGARRHGSGSRVGFAGEEGLGKSAENQFSGSIDCRRPWRATAGRCARDAWTGHNCLKRQGENQTTSFPLRSFRHCKRAAAVFTPFRIVDSSLFEGARSFKILVVDIFASWYKANHSKFSTL